jgi:hypothetical protein
MILQTIEIYLKSGHTITIQCEGANFTYDNTSGEYIGYSFKGLIKPIQMGLVPSQIVGWARIE